jgi:hypothetical protein
LDECGGDSGGGCGVQTPQNASKNSSTMMTTTLTARKAMATASYVTSPHNAMAMASPPSPFVASPRRVTRRSSSSSTTMTKTTKRMRVGFGRGGLGGRCLYPRRGRSRGNVGEERSRRINADVVRGKVDDVLHLLIESGNEENTEQFRYIRPCFIFDEEKTTESVSPHLEASYFVDK